MEGQGLGERLVAAALESLRGRGRKLVPLCPFVRAYLRRHPDQADLVAGDPAAPLIMATPSDDNRLGRAYAAPEGHGVL